MKKTRDSSNELVEKLYREHGQLVMGIARKILRDEVPILTKEMS